MLLNEHGNEVLMFENVKFVTVSWIEPLEILMHETLVFCYIYHLEILVHEIGTFVRGL